MLAVDYIGTRNGVCSIFHFTQVLVEVSIYLGFSFHSILVVFFYSFSENRDMYIS